MDQAGFLGRLESYYRDGFGQGDICLAFSGGADSTALLVLALDYAKARGSAVTALIVDHDLRDGSGEEAALCARRAQALGAAAIILKWDHDGVNTQIQHRARKARYGLLGEYCRKHNVTILLTGHNRDDHAETILMRRAREGNWRSRAGIGDISHAPIWPQLANVSLCRPLLSYSRAEIREFCKVWGADYVDDPSNKNLIFDRVKARQALARDTDLRRSCLEEGDKNRLRLEAEDAASRDWLVRSGVGYEEPGGLTLPLKSCATLDEATLADMIKCAGGREKRPDMAGALALLQHIQSPSFQDRTLGGMIVTHKDDKILMAREPASLLGRSGAMPIQIDLPPNQDFIWDRRFTVRTNARAITVRPLWPSRDQLGNAARAALKQFSPLIRQTQPGFYCGDRLIAAPTLNAFMDTENEYEAASCILARLQPERPRRPVEINAVRGFIVNA